MKKLSIILLLGIGTTINMYAELLMKGTSASLVKIKQIYNALESLYHSGDIKKKMLLAELYKSCDVLSDRLPRKLVFDSSFAINAHGLFDNKQRVIDEKQRFEMAVSLNLCGSDGIIEEETARIIRSSFKIITSKVGVPSYVYIELQWPIRRYRAF